MSASSIASALIQAGIVWADAQDRLFTVVVEPALQAFGLASYIEDAYGATLWFMAGAVQMVVLVAVLMPLERVRPFEAADGAPGTKRERWHAVRVDIVYTLIDRLGVLRLALFVAVDPLWNAVFGRMAVSGVDGWHLDQAIAPWWPGITDTALAGFVAYAFVLDFVGYALHRAQHRFEWWWALHAVHHSQRHMTLWTDSRNHLLDSVIVDTAFVLLARAIGVAPSQFVALVALSRLIESLSHANLDLRFGCLLERLVVGPRFHRVHHGIGIGHERSDGQRLGGCNFGVLLPLWDVLFRTARFDVAPGPTGIRDQLPAEGGCDYGRGFWAQQSLGLRRLARAFTCGRA
ncbi:MAG TPA: sterol desaturase family protein [Burkholderiales bacterium]|nr:sterol desaturase family protein [Burkholderiales bacterium]